jgi:hypothetical protein
MLRPLVIFLLSFMLVTCKDYHCEKCLEHPHDLDFPYSQGQVVVFTNNNGETKSYTMNVMGGYPPGQVCGDEHTIEINCLGGRTYFMIPGNGDLYFASFSSSVIVSSKPHTADQSIGVSGFYREKFAGVSTDKLAAGGKTYSDLLYFENPDRSTGVCTSFYYNDTYGLVQYNLYDGNQIKTWYLKP